MIGEIRDLETASIATNASPDRPSGFQHPAHERRTFSDCASRRYRCSNHFWSRFGRAIMAQRLVRRLCTHCKIQPT